MVETWKIENLQTRAIKIIHGRPECDQKCRLMTISNQKKYKIDLLMFKCLQGTSVDNFASYGERVTIMVQEAIKLHCVFQGSGQKPQKSPSGSKAHLVSTNCQLTFEV